MGHITGRARFFFCPFVLPFSVAFRPENKKRIKSMIVVNISNDISNYVPVFSSKDHRSCYMLALDGHMFLL